MWMAFSAPTLRRCPGRVEPASVTAHITDRVGRWCVSAWCKLLILGTFAPDFRRVDRPDDRQARPLPWARQCQPEVAVGLADVDAPRGRCAAEVDAAAVGTEAVAVHRTLDGVADQPRVHHEVVAMRAAGIGRHRHAPPGTPEQHGPRLTTVDQPPHQHRTADIGAAGGAYPGHGAHGAVGLGTTGRCHGRYPSPRDRRPASRHLLGPYVPSARGPPGA